MRSIVLLANSVREIPLEIVLELMGSVQDKKDKHNWRTSEGRITVKGSKFFNHDAMVGGGGSIDLVMHLCNLDFKSAVLFLSGNSGNAITPMTSFSSDSCSLSKTLPPNSVSEHWSSVRRYLTQTRQIGEELVDRLHQEGKIYADKFRNAVFLCDSGKGAELRGTGAVSFHGYRGEKSPFRIPENGDRIAFVESAIDAMSLKEFGFNGTILSFSGCAKGLVEKYGLEAIEKGLVVLAAFDNDQAGHAMFDNLKTAVPSVERLLPEGKDWNDDLKGGRRSHGHATW